MFFKEIKINKTDKEISARILKEIKNRIDYMNNVGLGYLTLNRKANTLSGGETQRINLASSLGSSLVGSTYILDEPSIGLHSRDNDLPVNPTKAKQLTNVRASGTDEALILTPPVLHTLEQALEFIDSDELVEVTPNSIRLRKKLLLEHERKRASRAAA